MDIRKLLASLTCLFFVSAQVGAVPIDKEGHTWGDLQKLAKKDQPIFFTSCVYSKDKYRWVMYFPAGQTEGWLALLMPDGRDYYWGGVANIGKASDFVADVGFGFQTQRIAKFIGGKLFESKFLLLKPQDFHMVFDSRPTFICPDTPEQVLTGMGLPVTASGVTLPVKHGEPLASFRPKLLKQGWMPVETFRQGITQDFTHLEGDAGSLYGAGFKEVELCDGGICLFHYKRRDECLIIMTKGKYLPASGAQMKVYSWMFDCTDAPTKPPAGKK